MFEKKIGGCVKIFLLLVVSLLFLSATTSFVSGLIATYDPSSTILDGWGSTGSLGHEEIIDSARFPDSPSTSSFVDSRMGDGVSSEFGFPEVVEEFVENITLWVYASTGNTAEFTFYLRQGSNNVCSEFVPGSSGLGWFSCTWDSPSGSLDDLRLYLGTVERASGGQPTNALVYASYLEVDTGPLPPVVSLLSPEVDDVILTSPASLDFVVIDDFYSSISSCSLFGNFSGSWDFVDELVDVGNDTVSSFSISENDGYYSWNVLCENDFGRSSFGEDNFSFFMNSEPPIFEGATLNETVINQSETIRFNVSITDYFGVDYANVTIKYPSGVEEVFLLDRDGDEFFLDFSDTMSSGTYEVVSIYAEDNLGKSGVFYPDLSFVVEKVVPDDFDLLSPVDGFESKNLSPLFSWEPTSEDFFGNYTLFVSLNSDLSDPLFVESSFDVFETGLFLSSNLGFDETYFWGVSAYNVFGNVVNSSVFMYTTDNTPPSVSLSTADFFISNYSFFEFEFSVFDDNTLDVCYLYTNSSNSWSVINSSDTISEGSNFLSGQLVEGFNLWNVECFDLAGNSAFASDNRTLVVDLSPPVIDLVSPVDGYLFNESNLVFFNYSVFDSYSDVESCSLLINGSVERTSFDVFEGFNSFERFLSDGIYSWQVSCVDSSNWVGFSDVYSLEVEALEVDPPVISLLNPDDNVFLNSSTIFFELVVESAVGIDNCSLFVDDSLNETVEDVDTFSSFNFSIGGFDGSHSWRVECVDDSLDNQVGVSDTRTFFVDLVDPVVDLISPVNDSWYTSNVVDFVFIPLDDNLDYCSLYTNESGSFDVVDSLLNPVSGSQNIISRSLDDGVFSWSVRCFDLSGRSSFAETFSVLVDTTPPKYFDINTSFLSPTNFSEGKVHNFSISWFDNFGVDSVLFEHNFSGEFVNETILGSDVYWFATKLNASSYSFRWHANDSAGNSNVTDFFDYDVLRGLPDINLYLNSTSDNLSVVEGSFVNISGEVLDPLDGEFSLLIDGSVVLLENGSFSLDYFFAEPGSYNVSLVFNETDNFLGRRISFFVDVIDVTPPVVSLEYPLNNTQISAGPRYFGFSVSDSSPIDHCAFFVDGSLVDNVSGVPRDFVEEFYLSIDEGFYVWRVECVDSFGNLGVSDSWSFEVLDLSDLFVNLSVGDEFEQGALINFNVSVFDLLGDYLSASVDSFAISGNSSVPWWNSSWVSRQNIVLNETLGEDIIEGIASINVSSPGVVCDEVRVVNHESVDSEEVLFLVNNSGSGWCEVLFEVSVPSNSFSSDYFVYYNNSDASAPSDALDLFDSVLFNAHDFDEDGNVQNPQNVLGKNDDTFARLEAVGGGPSTISVLGSGFVDFIPLGSAEEVFVRYRYAVPNANNFVGWYLSYNVEGSGFVNSFSGVNAVSKTTSPWDDITGEFSSLSWNVLNSTVLRGTMQKDGGGGHTTVDVFWFELNVSYKKDVVVTDTALLGEELLVGTFSRDASSSGFLSFNWSTQDLGVGDYSLVVSASRSGFDSAKNFSFISLVPDVTPPSVELLSPLNGSLQDRGVVNFSFSVFDHNLESCSLYLGDESNLSLNVSSSNVSNGLNSFEVELDYGKYVWNVWCNDSFGNFDFADENFSFDVFVPRPVVSSDLYENDSFVISWDLVEGADSYNVYVANSFDNFSDEVNFSVSESFFEYNVSGLSDVFFKITSESNGFESFNSSFAGVSSHTLKEGFNMVSVPFYLSEYELFDGYNDGLRFFSDCLVAIWEFDSSSNSFLRVDLVDGVFVPSEGSESFVEFDPMNGYFFEADDTCSLKIGGVVPDSDVSINLDEGQNLVPWLSLKEKSLPLTGNYDGPVINTDPEFSISHVNFYDPDKNSFVSSSHFVVNDVSYGWSRAINLTPLNSYYFNSKQSSVWLHNPLGDIHE